MKTNLFFNWFYKICEIPRSSGHEEKIAEFLCNFAKERELEYYKDEHRNVLIKKCASKGFENAKPVVLQGHTDMVCEKAMGSNHDFMNDPIRYYIDGNKIKAVDTTLGADDGISIALILAILESDIAHPALECLFTAEEETGLFGAERFDYSKIKSRKLINLDSEEDGVGIVSCAGGKRVYATRTDELTPCGKSFEVTVSGLAGGHSGMEIDCGRKNANLVLASFLERLNGVRISSFIGGTKENAITPFATAVISFDDESALHEAKKVFLNDISASLNKEDENLNIDIKNSECTQALSVEASTEIIRLILDAKTGVISMSSALSIVETSANIGIVKSERGESEVHISMRSLSEKLKEEAVEYNMKIAEKYGFKCKANEGYPCWERKDNSEMQKLYIEAYKKVNGKSPVITAIHAGLECGIIASHVPDMDMISLGADVKYVHSIREELDITSCESYINTVIEMLSMLAHE